MKEVYHRESALCPSNSSRSQSKDCDRDSYTQRKSNSGSKSGKTKKKKSKKKRYRSSSSSSSASKTSTRSRGSIKSNESNVGTTTQTIHSKEHLSTAQATSEYILDTQKSSSTTTENSDSFTVKPLFDTAGSKKILQKVIIDLKNETVSVEKHEENTNIEKSQIFHPNFLGDDMRKVEKWAKKLYNYRQKTFNF